MHACTRDPRVFLVRETGAELGIKPVCHYYHFIHSILCITETYISVGNNDVSSTARLFVCVPFAHPSTGENIIPTAVRVIRKLYRNHTSRGPRRGRDQNQYASVILLQHMIYIYIVVFGTSLYDLSLRTDEKPFNESNRI